jgi:HSP20 family protein
MVDANLLVRKENGVQTLPEPTQGETYFTPRVDICENDKELILCADMPGIRPEDVNLRYERGELVLHGRLKQRQWQGAFLLREYDEGDFYRVFTIHESIDNSRIEATCKNGVLTVRLPKTEAARPRQVTVRAD